MMDFYEQFKPKADQQVGKAVANVETLRKQLQKIKHRLQREKDNKEKIETQIKRLRATAAESLGGDDGSYEKYKVSLRKRTTELETSGSAIEDLETIVIPKTEDELSTARSNLGGLLGQWAKSSKPIAGKRISELLKTIDNCLIECVQTRRDFLNALEKIHSDYSFDFSLRDQNYYPGPWLGDETGKAERSGLLLVEYLAKQKRLGLPIAEPALDIEPEKPPAPELIAKTDTVSVSAPEPVKPTPIEKPVEKPEPFLQLRRECANPACGVDFTTADENVKLCPACQEANRLKDETVENIGA